MPNKIEILGAKELERKLRTLGDRVQRKVVRQSVNAAATPIVKAARAKAPRESGLLRKALNKKLRTYKDQGKVVAIIGPRTDVKGDYNGERRVPWRYATWSRAAMSRPKGSTFRPSLSCVPRSRKPKASRWES